MKLIKMKLLIQFSITLAALSLSTLPALADSNSSIKYQTNLAPSAQLYYAVKANHSGLNLNGEADIQWEVKDTNRGTKGGNKTYSITTETRAELLGKILEVSSFGDIDSFGLAPKKYEEKSLKKSYHTTFDRAAKKIMFSEPGEPYPLKDGEQDRTSAIWQLISIARASPKKFVPNSQWTFDVAGRRDADKWTFTVEKNVTLSTSFGKINTVHVTKNVASQRIDIWLAPSMEWYPVRIKFSDVDGDTIEQNLMRIKKLSAL